MNALDEKAKRKQITRIFAFWTAVSLLLAAGAFLGPGRFSWFCASFLSGFFVLSLQAWVIAVFAGRLFANDSSKQGFLGLLMAAKVFGLGAGSYVALVLLESSVVAFFAGGAAALGGVVALLGKRQGEVSSRLSA